MTQSFKHKFNWLGRNFTSTCLVKVYSDDGENLICFEDLSMGTSVTNASEQLATEIVDKFKFNPGNCRFFETYDNVDFDEITYTWVFTCGRLEARDPMWTPAPTEIKSLFIL